MKRAVYKYERFEQPEFPIYISSQSGRPELVKIHYHVAAEIIWVREGRIQMLIGNTYRECEKGDIIFLPPSVVHGATSLTENATIQGITYKFSLLNFPDLQIDFSELFHRSQRLQYIVSRHDKEYGELSDCLRNIIGNYGSFTTSTKIQTISYLLQVMSRLIQIFSLEEGVHSKNYLKLLPALAYAEDHFSEKIQISDLSDIIHVCDDRLIRLFKEVTGETPIEYIMNLRIEAGIKLLASTNLSIAEVAEQTGFGSDTYMTRIFKKKLNITPGKYRNR